MDSPLHHPPINPPDRWIEAKQALADLDDVELSMEHFELLDRYP